MSGHLSSSSIAFGSCSRQNLPQDYWTKISLLHPKAFLWLGDVVYSKGNSIANLEKAYKSFLENTQYINFTNQNILIDGVWDDHDYGVNDGGANVPDKDIRKDAYLNFLKRSGNKNIHIPHEGLYHDLDLSLEDTKIKVIFLDTRFFRSSHYVRSLGEFHFPLSAIIASAFRGAYSVLGFGRAYDGTILGEEQWKWLEDTLLKSNAEINIIASSIQVLTSNPVFESWGHFPVEKKRLFKLLKSTDPLNLFFLSGDVHLGEFSIAKLEREDQKDNTWLEITSSGLTHTCADNIVNRILCPTMMYLFNNHRLHKENYFTGKNFGSLTITKNALTNEKLATFDVLSLETEYPVPQLSFSFNVNPGVKSNLLDVEVTEFPNWVLQISAILFVLFLVILFLFKSCKRQKKQKVV